MAARGKPGNGTPPARRAARGGQSAVAGEQAWVEVIKKMDDVYHELLDYESALEGKNAELEASQQFIRSVLSSMSDVLLVCNRSGLVEELNPALLALTGRDEQALLGSNWLELVADREARATLRAQLLEHPGEPLADLEVPMVAAGGSSVPVTLSCTPRLDAAGRPQGLVVTGRPVGELRRAYSALTQAHEDLKRTQQQLLHAEKMASLGRLVAGVAHELNNPISFVLGNVVVLRKYLARIGQFLDAVEAGEPPGQLAALRASLGLERLRADLPSLIDGTIEGAERTRDVVDSLKRFSAPGAQALEPVELVAVVRRAIEWVSKSAPGGFRVATTLPEALWVRGNAGQLQQVVMNLVQNAADATAGLADARLVVHGQARRGYAVLDFTDNGPGIAPGNFAKVFDPFFTTKPVGKGTGLGLSISYGIVEAHGGRLAVSNAEGGGAIFQLSVPLHERP